MTNHIQIPKHGASCHLCTATLIIYTPVGADYTTCPICHNYNDFSNDDFDDNDIDVYWCNKCKIIFALGCDHAVNGCTDNAYYALLVYSYKIKGKNYVGMPLFDTSQQLIKDYKSYDFNWICTCKGMCADCPRSIYKQTKCCEFNLKHIM
jgi:hypothetical protein